MPSNIILIGFMGSGKDTVGRVLAAQTGRPFLSTDQLLEQQENRSIGEIFREAGEAYFRDRESSVLEAIADLQNVVVATGGGMVLREKNRRLLSRMGPMVYLKTDLSVLENRLSSDTARPLIQDQRRIRELFMERMEAGAYDFADLVVDGAASPDEITGQIITEMKLSPKKDLIETQRITVNTASKTYPVVVSADISAAIGPTIRRLPRQPQQAVIVTNPLVSSLFLGDLQRSLTGLNVKTLTLILPDGETFKTLATVRQIYDFLLTHRISRFVPLIALGGGVIGDMTGFAASTYKRGMPFIQIPTTLLAQIDASVGGKTGVNHADGKNMIGTFYQPEAVLCDVNSLLTLSEREFRNGLAEALKYAFIRDRELSDFMLTEKVRILQRDRATLIRLVRWCVEIKRQVVEQDEQETKGWREVLNFGHTIGHAIESLTGFGACKHGEAVAIGMVAEARLAQQSGWLDEGDFKRLSELIQAYDLPVEVPPELNKDNILALIRQDKKARQETIRIPVVDRIGHAIVREVSCAKFS